MTKPDAGLRAIFRERLPQFDWCSIESGTTGRGIPDSNYCADGMEGWIEFKATPGWTCPLRPEQVGWLARRARYGGRVWIAVRQRGTPRTPRDRLWLIPGDMAREAKAHGLEPLLSHRRAWKWEAGPSQWNWDSVATALTSRNL
jgi:hypothetical protein